MHIAVVGGGWAGLGAAVEAVARGWRVSVFEMAPHWGGRARGVRFDAGPALDNGQHILIGAYAATLGLMRRVGVDPDALLWRLPLALHHADGRGLALAPGPPRRAFLAAVWRQSHWSRADRLRLGIAAASWSMRGFRCPPDWSVERLARRLPPRVRAELIEPLCVAALNTPMAAASAGVFLRVLRDALFGAPGASDLLLPRVDLDALFPAPAVAWMEARGASLASGARVERLERDGDGWRVDGERFDAVVLAASAGEAARLAAAVAPEWSARARALRHQPILTVYARAPDGARLAAPMLALRGAPAQFAFDLGATRGLDGLVACVASGAAHTLEAGLASATRSVCDQAQAQLGLPLVALHALAERRATFACTPALVRPGTRIARGLVAAADYVAGPYPATLEGALRASIAAIAALQVEAGFRDSKCGS